MAFLIPYKGYTFGTEKKKMKEVEGVLVAFEFTQRPEMPQGGFFAEYKVKDVKTTSSRFRTKILEHGFAITRGRLNRDGPFT